MGNIEIEHLFTTELPVLAERNRIARSSEFNAMSRDSVLNVDVEQFCIYVQGKYGFDVPTWSKNPMLLEPEETIVHAKPVVKETLCPIT